MIRKGIVEADLFEAVIGLAPNLFFGASIPVAICVLNKTKPAERRGKVLFVDAAQAGCFRQGKAQNFIDPEHIDKIVGAYQAFEDVERFAHVADLEEIRANDFNLNISRYVDTTEPVAVMSVEDALAQLREAERRRDEATAKMDELLAELGYSRRLGMRLGWSSGTDGSTCADERVALPVLLPSSWSDRERRPFPAIRARTSSGRHGISILRQAVLELDTLMALTYSSSVRTNPQQLLRLCAGNAGLQVSSGNT